MPRIGQACGLNPDRFSDRDQIGFVRLEERNQGRQQRRIVRPTPEFIRPDSSQREEPLGPTLVNKRCCERGKTDGYGIIVWFLVRHSLGNCRKWSKERSWRRS